MYLHHLTLTRLSTLSLSIVYLHFQTLFLLLDDPYFKKLVDSQSLKKIKAYIINNNLIFINENEIFNFLDQETFQSIFTIDTDVNDTILQIKLIISLLMKCFIRDK